MVEKQAAYEEEGKLITKSATIRVCSATAQDLKHMSQFGQIHYLRGFD